MCETSDHLSLWLSLSLQMCEYVHCTWTPHVAVVQHLLPIDLSFIALLCKLPISLPAPYPVFLCGAVFIRVRV